MHARMGEGRVGVMLEQRLRVWPGERAVGGYGGECGRENGAVGGYGGECGRENRAVGGYGGECGTHQAEREG